MRLTLLESDRTFLRSAEWASLSIMAHVTLVWLAVSATAGGGHLPTDEREARVFFLLPPDRVKASLRQTDVAHWKQPGVVMPSGDQLKGMGEGLGFGGTAPGARRTRKKSAAGDEVPFGPAAQLRLDSVFSVLEVDQMVQRYEGSAAPEYPPPLMAAGTEGQVVAIYVVDTTGGVDTATIQVVESSNPLFTESVRTALGGMRFRPAKRAGHTVRQLVQQRFSFRITPSSQASGPSS
jgi:TonB family protein